MGLQNAGPEITVITDEVFAQTLLCRKILLVHFISKKLNFPVLSMFKCAAPQNTGFMDCILQV